MAPRFVVVPDVSLEVRQTAYAAVFHSWNASLQVANGLTALFACNWTETSPDADNGSLLLSLARILRPSLLTQCCFCGAAVVLCAREIHMQHKTRRVLYAYGMYSNAASTDAVAEAKLR